MKGRPTWPRRPRWLAARAPFFGWWIVLAGVAIDFLIAGFFTQAYGAYVVMLRAEFGWSATLLSLVFGLAFVEQGLLGPLQGWLVDHYGPRRVVSVGVCLLAIGLVLFGHVSSVETLFAAVFVIALGASLGGFASLTVAVVNWFERRRATALGIQAIGNYAGSLLLPLVVMSFALFGWRATATLSALAIFIVGVPAAQVLRHRPEAHGLLPDGATPGDAHAIYGALPQTARSPRFTLAGALHARRFWYLSFGHACAGVVVSAVTVHLVPYLTGSLGFTLAEASGLVVILSLVTIVGALMGGAAGDRFDRRNVLVACMCGHGLGMLLLTYSAAGWMVVAFALLHGLAWGVRGPLMSSIRADYFGRTAYGAISGLSHVVVMMGMMAGPLVAGLTRDLSGSYTVGFTAIMAIAAIGAGFFMLASRAAPSTASLLPVGA